MSGFFDSAFFDSAFFDTGPTNDDMPTRHHRRRPPAVVTRTAKAPRDDGAAIALLFDQEP